ncbi:hypothetical protein WJX72_003854 [[Myrmecia] bisecta]|uniref:Uncharacterized protein n=1 Tax=[Myrmecia] bisecta TaxID=41462 RepID=A0AAW1PPU1_9CHLO
MQQQENRVPLDTNRLPYRKSEYRGVAAAIRSTHPEGLLGSSPLVTAVKTAATAQRAPKLEAAAFESVPIGDDCNVEAGDKENAPPEAGAGAAGEGPAEASKNWSYKMRLPIWPVTVTMGVAISGADSPAGAKPEQPLESICCHSYPTPQQPSSRPTTPSGSGRSFEPPPLMLAPIPAIKAPTKAPAASWVGADLEASPDMQLLFENQQMKQERDELRAELRRISERLAALETMTIKTGPKGRSRSAPRKAKGGSQGGSRPASPFVQPAQRTANQELAGQAIQAEHAQRSMHPSMRAGSTGRLPQPGAMSNPFQSLQYPPGFNSQAQASPGVQGQSLNAQAHDAVHRFTGVEYCMDAETGSEQSSLAGSGIQKQDSFASELAASSGPVPHNGRRRRNRRGRSNTPPPRLPEQPPVVLTQPSAALFTQELPARQPGRPEQGSQGRSRSNGRRRNRSHTPEMLRHAGHAAGPQHAQRPQGQRYSSPNLMPSQGPQYQASTAARPHSRNGAGYGSKENANPGRPAAGQAFGSKVSSAAGTAALLGINLSHSDFQPQSRAEGMNQAQRGVLQESNSALRATAAPFQLPYAVGNTQGQLR